MSFLESKSQFMQDKVRDASKLPGCYKYLNSQGEVIYVGKAKNLSNRVKSYFNNYERLDPRIRLMVEESRDIEMITVDTEIEALILETNLIKKYKPRYNVLMRDDKSYSYIAIEKVKKGVNDFPRIKLIRNTDLKEDQYDYFGPYLDNVPLKNILKRLRKVFPYASCNRRLVQVSEDPLKVDTNNSIPCLYYHLGLCKAPCASLQAKREYLKNINNIKKFLNGEKLDIVKDLEKQMEVFSKAMEYELAARVRDRINEIKYVTANIRIDNSVDDIVVEELKRTYRAQGIDELIKYLNFPQDKLKNHPGFRIECYDISNIQGTNPVSAMTVIVDGDLKPNLYRRFKIMSKETPDDFLMHQETLGRRLKYISKNFKKNKSLKEDESFMQKPDLIIIDGGKGQLSATYLILKEHGLENDIPIVGLAKKEEEVFKMREQFKEKIETFDNKFERVLLPRKTEALFTVQKIRDEAHRFGITYHRKLRSKKMVFSD